ncbi:helix-turn-helix transcriptional regulator [Asaia siamensis]
MAIPDINTLPEQTIVHFQCTIAPMHIDILNLTDYQAACGYRLRRVIELLDLTFTDAAKIMGISKGVLNHWMAGNNPIQPYALYRLSRSRGITFDYIFLGNWSGLPHLLAAQIEKEMLSGQVASSEEVRSDA